VIGLLFIATERQVELLLKPAAQSLFMIIGSAPAADAVVTAAPDVGG
jgi:hypothetical protein